MSCDDFIEFVKKNDGIRKNKRKIDRQIRLRFQQITMFGGLFQPDLQNDDESPRKEQDQQESEKSIKIDE